MSKDHKGTISDDVDMKIIQGLESLSEENNSENEDNPSTDVKPKDCGIVNSNSNRNFQDADKAYQASKLRNNQEFDTFISKLKMINSNGTQLSNKEVYAILSHCNKYITDIHHDINVITDYIKFLYTPRFPELSSIITNPHDYVRTVKTLGNDLNNNRNKNEITYLENNITMALNIMSSSSSGKVLKNEDMQKVYIACDEVLGLYDCKKAILIFIEKNMETIAPNLSTLLGTNIASKLVTSAGGIVELAKIPGGNIMVMGAQRVNLEGFSSVGKLHRGYLTELEEYQKAPDNLKIKVVRRYANKAALAARADAFRVNCKSNANICLDSSTLSLNEEENLNLNLNDLNSNENKNQKIHSKDQATIGENLKKEISQKIEKISEPKQPNLKKPLPKPDDKPRRKRGGVKMRSIKKRYELTEIRAMKNRTKFGPEAETEYRDTGEGFGLLKVGGTGSKLKTATSNKSQKISMKKHKILAMKSQMEDKKSGLHSSVVFTPVEGIELINPELLQSRLSKANEKYFSATSGFNTVINQNMNKGVKKQRAGEL